MPDIGAFFKPASLIRQVAFHSQPLYSNSFTEVNHRKAANGNPEHLHAGAAKSSEALGPGETENRDVVVTTRRKGGMLR
jgi:hypothetical protein